MASKFLLLLALVTAIEESTELVLQTKDCGSELGELTSMDINCDEGSSAQLCKLTVGKKYTGKIMMTPHTMISNGTIVLHAIIGPVTLPFPFHDSDLCKDHDVTCPLKADTGVTVDIIIDVPSIAPKVNLVAKMEIQSNGKDLLCTEFLGSIN